VSRVLPSVTTTAYVTPLREGGSLPGIVEADDLGTYVAKFTAAGQGAKALVAEIIVGELGRRLGLRVPRLVLLEVDAAIGRSEPDEEVQELLVASAGTNLGVDFLPGAVGFDPRGFRVDPVEAAQIVWLDAFTANVDRSWRNPNLLVWHRQLWCIDHGAALRFHHDWSRRQRFATATYDYGDHVLGERAAPLQSAAEQAAATVSPAMLHEVLDMVPDAWLEPDELRPDVGAPADADEARRAYCETLLARLDASEHWLSAVAPQ
jgi:hypothetical protein